MTEPEIAASPSRGAAENLRRDAEAVAWSMGLEGQPVPEGWVDEQVTKSATVAALERAADNVEGYDTDPRQRGWRDGILHAASIVRETPPRSLFTWGRFTAASGRTLDWKIECDALTAEDWRTLAQIAVPHLPVVTEVIGIPTGGEAFAQAIREVGFDQDAGAGRRLIVDDVWTTGGSVAKFYEPGDFVLVAFARGLLPTYATAIWTLDEGFFDARSD